LSRPASRPKALLIGGNWTLLFLLCVSCVGGRTPLTDAGAASLVPGGDQSSWDGGLLPSTPGQIRCGSITCGFGDQCCLRDPREGSPASNGCDSRAEGTCHGSQYVRTCDEPADCYPGESCCWELVTAATISSICSSRGTCSNYYFTACGTDDDCRAAGAPPCVAQRCRGDIIQSCGPLPSGYCRP
jgi:hypothetical protein